MYGGFLWDTTNGITLHAGTTTGQNWWNFEGEIDRSKVHELSVPVTSTLVIHIPLE